MTKREQNRLMKAGRTRPKPVRFQYRIEVREINRDGEEVDRTVIELTGPDDDSAAREKAKEKARRKFPSAFELLGTIVGKAQQLKGQ